MSLTSEDTKGPSGSFQITPREGRQVRTDANASASRQRFRKGLPPWLSSFFFPSLGCLLFGFDIGCSSSVIRILGDLSIASSANFGDLSASVLGLIAATSLFGALASSAVAFRFGDDLGRKRELITSAFLYTVGTIVEATAPNLVLLFIGRFLYGGGIGFAMHAAPIYIAECVPTNRRGLLISLKEAFIVSGIVFGYLVGALWEPSFSFVDAWLSWRFMFGSGVLFCLPFLLGSFILPESPRWLILKASLLSEDGIHMDSFLARSYAERAKASLVRLVGNNEYEAEEQFSQFLQGVSQGAYNGNEMLKEFSFSELLSAQAKKPLLIAIGLVTFQQVTGQPSVLYFANRIFEDAGFGFIAAVGLGIWKLLMTTFSAVIVDKLGRRPLLLSGTTLMTLSLFLLAWLFSGLNEPSSLTLQVPIIISIFLYVGAYQIGFGPISWLLLSEIFPLRIRSAALALGTLINFSTNLLVTSTFEVEKGLLGTSGLFLQFGIIGFISIVFIYRTVIETKGLSLEEIEERMRQ
eukprot:jgi/Galph1/875/GphlegSOOS_G5673.1